MWKDFFQKLNELRASNEPFAVGTVVKVSGSTYRRPGARVIITKDGASTGLISGGCFEGDLMERAKHVLKGREAVTVTFDTTSPDDLIFGLGLGCTGIAHILLEPFQGTAGQEHLNFIWDSVQHLRNAALATIFDSETVQGAPVGAHLMLSNEDQKIQHLRNNDVAQFLLTEATRVLDSGQTTICTYEAKEGSVSALIESLELPVSLTIFGAGPDAVPLVRFATQIGWRVTVIDRRPAFARSDRFPGADAVLLCEPEDVSKALTLDEHTAAVVMTHHFETDANYLQELIPSPVSYIGILGPKSKSEMLLDAMRETGLQITDQQRSRIYGPVGLDIGAETPEEIALSIISEIQAVKTSHPSGSLRERSRPIHEASQTPKNL